MRRFFVGGLGAVLLLALPRVAQAQDLAPPPPMAPSPPSGQPLPSTPDQQATTENLQEGEKKDSGRGLEWVWLQGEVGASYINMEQFNSTTFGLQKASSAGPMFGFGAGIRLLVFTIGVRARLNDLSVFNLWQINGEIGLHIPLGSLDPYVSIHGGYAFVGTLNAESLTGATSSSAGNVTIHGFNAGLSGGGDYYFNHFLSIGLDVTLDALFLTRPPVALPTNLPPAVLQQIKSQPLYAESGDSVGFGISGSGHLGIHF